MSTKIEERAGVLRENLAKEMDLDEETMKVLSQIDLQVTTGYTLADAIREGCTVTEKAEGWGDGDTACALTSALVAAKARGYA